MQSERYQKELFEFEEPKKSFPKLNSILPKNDFALVVTLEKLIFAIIGILMLMVIIYALGVERGKGIAYSKIRTIRLSTQKSMAATPAIQPPAAQKSEAKAPARTEARIAAGSAPQQPRPAMPAQPDVRILSGTSGSATIVAVTFSTYEFAAKEADALKRAGFDSFVTQSDRYSVVCVRAGPDAAKAKAVLNKIKKIYKDAYIKPR